MEAPDAPHGLRIVQELLNTAASGAGASTRPDLLNSGADAKRWADQVAAALEIEPGPVDDQGAALLREVRESIRSAILTGGTRVDVSPAVPISLRVGGAGDVELLHTASASGIAGLVLSEVLRAQARADWQRLKLCALVFCGSAFWDRSKNMSARYHLAFCSNYVNLHASRRRRQNG